MPAKRQAAAAARLAQRLHGAAIRLLRRVRREDAALGLPPAQASALSVLVFGGAQTLSALADAEQVRAPTMTRIVDALERAGCARRESDPDDRRRTRIVATAAGSRLMQEGRVRRERALAGLLDGLDRRDLATLEAAVTILEKRNR